jgi:hypothetical protein
VAWQLRHGEAAAINVPVLQKRGAPIPAYYTPPTLADGFMSWFYAFFDLSTERKISGGPIPASAIRSWPLPEHERDLFHRCIRAMDRVFLDHYAPKTEEPTATKPFGPGMLKGKA